MDETPCDKLRPEEGPVCYLGRNMILDCTGCSSYREQKRLTELHWQVWEEIRSGGATRSAGGNNHQAGERGGSE